MFIKCFRNVSLAEIMGHSIVLMAFDGFINLYESII